MTFPLSYGLGKGKLDFSKSYEKVCFRCFQIQSTICIATINRKFVGGINNAVEPGCLGQRRERFASEGHILHEKPMAFGVENYPHISPQVYHGLKRTWERFLFIIAREGYIRMTDDLMSPVEKRLWELLSESTLELKRPRHAPQF